MRLVLVIMSLLSFVNASEKSVCGRDQRVPSDDKKVGRVIERMSDAYGCSATLINKNCLVTAGHCLSTLKYVEFNTPSVAGQNSEAEDVYQVDQRSIKTGNDWAVFKLHKNVITGEYAGDVQGFYNVSFNSPGRNARLRVTGYGAARRDLDFTQQTHVGSFLGMSGSRIRHDVDTEGGNSGSSILNEQDNTVVGVHTNGGCSRWSWWPGRNSGTAFYGNDEFQNAVIACLSGGK